MNARKLFYCILFLALCVHSTAFGAFSPQLSSLEEKAENGAPITVRLTFSADTLFDFQDETLEAVQSFLSGTQAKLSIQKTKNGSDESLSLLVEEDPWIQLSILTEDGQTKTVFGTTGNAYLTESGSLNAAWFLLDNRAAVPFIDELLHICFERSLPVFYERLSSYEDEVSVKQVRENTTIKNVGTAANYVQYSAEGEALTGLWTALCENWEELWPLIYPQQPSMQEESKNWFSSLVFSGNCRIKRLLSKEGKDLGIQFSGRLLLPDEEEERKINLLFGFQEEKGVYCSLTAPSVKNGDDFSLKAGMSVKNQTKQNTLSLSVDFSEKHDKVKHTITLSGTLNNKYSDDQDRISGKITMEDKTGSAPKKTTVIQTEGFLNENEGTIRFPLTVKEGGNTLFSGAFDLHIGTDTVFPEIKVLRTTNLGALSETEQTALLLEESKVTFAKLLSYLNTLPEDVRFHLAHAFRTEAWMNAPVLSADEKITEIKLDDMPAQWQVLEDDEP